MVETGFSVNKELLVENLTERSLIAQRIVHDSIQNAGGKAINVDVSNKSILSHFRFGSYT